MMSPIASLRTASLWRRLIAFVIDYTLFFLLNLIPGFIFGFLIGSASRSSYGYGSNAASGVLVLGLTVLSHGVGIYLSWRYYVLTLASQERATYGMKLLRIQVTNLEGETLTRAQAAYRIAWMNITVLLFPLLLLGIFSPRHRFLHDLRAGARVVRSAI